MSEERITGTVKWASHEMGFGFVEHKGRTYAFMPNSEIQAADYRALLEGENVTFVVSLGQQGPQASRLWRVNT